MSEPTYTVIAVTERFVIAVDASGQRDKQPIRAPAGVQKGDVLTAEQWRTVDAE